MTDRRELEQQVTAGEKARETLSRLKALDAVTEEVAELQESIAALEAEGSFGQAGPLKVELARLASRGSP